ncbi:hypothetical protein [Stutzerimonas stutzeri]|uniref:hypothetical protein n=1 Tax=Stutzerimonas stutzeri TaxID=316 RepID=UPI000838337B|nr:hypothetical protein [Stutzerimonas stutzeri]OCX57208.1 hypothetical protein BFM99_14150 [Stutzerimonas stutzeri]
MKALEEKFGRKHPALEDFVDPPAGVMWLVDAFFRLHRRRQHAEHGYQPLQYQEMAQFADHVLNLEQDLRPLFFRTMEETDNGVLYDHYAKAKERTPEAPRPKKLPRPTPRR